MGEELNQDRVIVIEYEACLEGIARFDGLMFRVRQWNATATAALAAAAIAAPEGMESDKFFLVAIALNVVFWLYDAMQKSLQMNFVLRSRELEQILSARATQEEASYDGMKIAQRFAGQHNRHWARALRALPEQSLLPFYLLPILGCVAGIVAW